MDSDSILAGMIAIAKEIGRLRALKVAAQEFVDYQGDCVYGAGIGEKCQCEYCDLQRALESCNENH